jgi:hypothetical protein
MQLRQGFEGNTQQYNIYSGKYLKHYFTQINNLSFSSTLRNWKRIRCWWLTPIILATWEAESGRTEVQDQSRQIVGETPSPK